MAKTIYVDCAFCKGVMEVNAETGEVLQKWEPSSKKDKGDKMASALKKLADAKAKRNGMFEGLIDEMGKKKKKNEALFDKEVEKVKKEGVGEKPLRPFDLD